MLHGFVTTSLWSCIKQCNKEKIFLKYLSDVYNAILRKMAEIFMNILRTNYELLALWSDCGQKRFCPQLFGPNLALILSRFQRGIQKF